MTTPTAPTAERIKAAKVFFEEQLKDRIAYDKKVAALDDPFGLVHPIYIGKMVEPYYRIILALLDSALANRKKSQIPSIAGELIDRESAEDEVYPSLQSEQPGQSVGQEESDLVKSRRAWSDIDFLIEMHAKSHDDGERYRSSMAFLRSLLLSPPAPRKVSRGRMTDFSHSVWHATIDDIRRRTEELLRELGLEVEDEC